MVPCLHQSNIYLKRKLRVWRDRKCISLVGAKTPLTCAGRQSTPFQWRRYSAEREILRKLGWTYRHGTMFAPGQYLYEIEAMGMERPELYFPSQCKNAHTYVGRQTTPTKGRRYIKEKGNLRKLGWTYHHGTIFAPKQCLHQKEATGMERPEMYFPSRCRNPTHLCGLSKYPFTREAL